MSDISDIKVSIIMPVYNGADVLAQTIDSIVAQSVVNWELLIADNGSSDGSSQIIQTYCQTDTRIQYLDASHKKGAAYARNCAIKKARGRYIAFVDADDIWRADKLEIQLSEMEKHDVAFSFSWYYEFEEDTDNIKNMRAPSRQFFEYKHIIRNSSIGCSTAMYDAQILGKRYMPTIKMRQDWLLWLSILETHKGLCIHDPLVYYRLTPDSLSANKIQAAKYQWVALREGLNLPLHKAIFYFSTYMRHHIMRLVLKRIKNT